MKGCIKKIICLCIFIVFCVSCVTISYAETIENVYVYFTDDGKTLHFTSDKNKGTKIETTKGWTEDRFDLFEKEIYTTKKGEKKERVNTKKVNKIIIDKKISPKSCCYLFSFINLTEIVNIKNLDTKNVINFEGMFMDCAMKEIDLSSFNWNNCKTVDFMFSGCVALEKVKLGKLKEPKLEDISGMFNHCSKIKEVDFNNWNFDKLVEAIDCFSDCESLEQVIFPKSQPRLKEIGRMFKNCKNIKFIDLSNLLYNNEQVEYFDEAFSGCTNLKEIKFNTLNYDQFKLSSRDVFSDIADDGKVVFKDKNCTKKEILSNINLKSKKDIIEHCQIEVYRKDFDTDRYIISVSPLDKHHQFNNVSFDLTIYILEGQNMYTNISWSPEKTVVKKITLDQNGKFENEYHFLKDAGYSNPEVWEGSVWRLWYNEIENVNGTVVDLNVK